jgi:hypothetical protein
MRHSATANTSRTFEPLLLSAFEGVLAVASSAVERCCPFTRHVALRTSARGSSFRLCGATAGLAAGICAWETAPRPRRPVLEPGRHGLAGRVLEAGHTAGLADHA